MAQNQVDLVRCFNRVFTQRIGALDGAYLSRGRSLGLSRLLWVIEPAGSEVRLLRARLGLNSAITLPMTEDTARIPRICPSAAIPGTGFSAGGVVSGCHRRGRENKLLGNSFLSQRAARPCLRRSGQKEGGGPRSTTSHQLWKAGMWNALPGRILKLIFTAPDVRTVHGTRHCTFELSSRSLVQAARDVVARG
jgi:hypothetical protein